MADHDYEAGVHFGQFAKSDFSSVNIRLGFIRKVYLILSFQLLLTFGMSLVSVYTSFGEFQTQNPGLLIGTTIFALIICLAMMCCKDALNKVPTNYILLFLFTFCEAYAVGAVVRVYSDLGYMRLVLWAVALTAALTASLTIYAWTTKTDITTWGGFLFCLAVALLFFGIMAVFSGLRILQIIYSICAILVYGTYLVFDTQLIIGGQRFQLDVDDYIMAALQLYLDIIILFLEILRLLALTEK